MAQQELVLIHKAPAVAQSFMENLCDRRPTRQSLLDRNAAGLAPASWPVGIGNLRIARYTWKLYGVHSELLAQNTVLGDWLLARARLTILLVDGDGPGAETELRTLLEAHGQPLAGRELAVLIQAAEQPDADSLARYFTILRQHGHYVPVEWAPTERNGVLASLKAISDSSATAVDLAA